MPTVLTVEIDQISISRNRCPIQEEKVIELMQSIRANGLLNPITVDQKLNLIAGLHRLTACKMLGLLQIECNIVNYKAYPSPKKILPAIESNKLILKVKGSEEWMLERHLVYRGNTASQQFISLLPSDTVAIATSLTWEHDYLAD